MTGAPNLFPQIVQDGKSDTPSDNRDHHRHQHQRICGVAHQTVRMNRKTRSVECRDGMKQTAPCGLTPS
jgi:ABC-type nickel/cobalt efflux system permease component RcnA